MDEPGDDVLPDASLSADEDLRIGPGCTFDLLLYLTQGRTCADQIAVHRFRLANQHPEVIGQPMNCSQEFLSTPKY